MDGKNTFWRGNMPQLELDIFNLNKIMKFTIQQKELLSALSICTKGIKTSITNPVLECFKLSLSEKQCTITGSCSELYIVKTIPVIKSEYNKDICVNSKKLLDYIKTLSDQELNFEIKPIDKGYLVVLKTSSGKIQLPGEETENYPQTPIIESHKIEIDSAVLNRAISKTTFACSPDSSMVYSSALVEFGNGINIVGTDAKTIAVQNVFENTINLQNCLVRPFILNTISSLGFNGDVNISYSDRWISFDYGNTIVFGILSEGKFPAYSAFIPENHPIKITVDIDKLTRAVSRVLIVANVKTGHCVFTFENKQLIVKSSDKTVNQEGSETIDCDYDGESFSIGFIGSQITNIVSKLETDTATFWLKDEKTVCLIKGDETDVNLFLNVPSVI